jgi:hypothetical protein
MGYCNEYHFKRGLEDDKLFSILEKNPNLSTIRDARKFLSDSNEKQEKTNTSQPKN